jgi:hypothetical protein
MMRMAVFNATGFRGSSPLPHCSTAPLRNRLHQRCLQWSLCSSLTTWPVFVESGTGVDFQVLRAIESRCFEGQLHLAGLKHLNSLLLRTSLPPALRFQLSPVTAEPPPVAIAVALSGVSREQYVLVAASPNLSPSVQAEISLD